MNKKELSKDMTGFYGPEPAHYNGWLFVTLQLSNKVTFLLDMHIASL